MSHCKHVIRSLNKEYLYNNDSTHRVGVRHKEQSPHSEGGGYLNNYTTFECSLGRKKNSRQVEIESLDIPDLWKNIAKKVGFENFVEIWQLMEAETTNTDSTYLYIPRFSTFIRQQRNLFIRSLADEGYNHQKIIIEVNKKLQQSISSRTVDRALNSTP